MYKCQNTYTKSKTFISPRVVFRFLPNLQGLSKITKKCKKYKSINLKTN